MKKLFFLIIILTMTASCVKEYDKSHIKPDSKAESKIADQETGVVYDSLLAARLGADNYGMRMYFFAFLSKGPNVIADSAESARLLRGHLDNIQRLADENKIVLAGPYGDEGDLMGFFIYNAPTIEEARALAATDPMIDAGLLSVKIRPWYGSAAVMQINEIHNTLAKELY